MTTCPSSPIGIAHSEVITKNQRMTGTGCDSLVLSTTAWHVALNHQRVDSSQPDSMHNNRSRSMTTQTSLVQVVYGIR